MPSRWSLPNALGSIESAVWSTPSIGAVGLIEPAGNGWTELHFRTRLAVSQTRMPSAEYEPGGLIDRIRGVWKLGPLVRVPIGVGGAELYVASVAEVAASTVDTALDTARGLAERVQAVAGAGEPIDILDDRMTRIEAIGDVLQALGSALDLREVFNELSAVARRAVPHDLSVVSLHEDEHHRIRRYALSAPAGWTLPDVVENPYPTQLSSAWTSVFVHDLAKHPLEQNLDHAMLGLRSAVRVRIQLDDGTSGGLDFSAFGPDRYTDADVPIVRRI